VLISTRKVFPIISFMKFIRFLFLIVLLPIFSYGYMSDDEILFVLKNHSERGFYFDGEVASRTYKVTLKKDSNERRVFVNLSKEVFEVVSVYSTVLVLDKKPSYELMEYLLRANNYNQSIGFFYIYYDISLDKWFIDYCVRMRQEDIDKHSLIASIKLVAMFSDKAYDKLKVFLD